MRPRHKAAEYGAHGRVPSDRRGGASMRPRHKAAEYDALRDSGVALTGSFNEAAA